MSPIIGGKALKGPADRLDERAGPRGIGRRRRQWYQDIVGTLVIDTVDEEHRAAIEALGVEAIVMATIMSEPDVTDRLAATCAGQG